MSEVDNHIVQITLDNKEFEANVSATIDSLEKLQNALKSTDGTKSLDNLNESAKNVDLSNLQEGFEKSQTAATMFGNLAASAITEVISKVESLSQKLISTFVTGPLKAGFSQYMTTMDSTQVMLSNYRGVENLDTITSALDELNVYANKTIFSFSQMTQGIAKFAAAGVDLDDSVAAMKGLANAGALVGANNQKLYMAFYNLSQSMTNGYLSYIDWKSIANAGIGNKTMREAFVKTAISMGKFAEGSDEANYALTNFQSSLTKNKWLTNDVITKTLEIYTYDYDNLVTKVNEATGATEYFTQAGEKVEDWMVELGHEATAAATQVKSFSQLWDVLIETVQSSWSTSWKKIIGDLDEAKEFWSAILDSLQKPIDALDDARNEMLDQWRQWGGYRYLTDAIKECVSNLMTFYRALYDAWERVFPDFGKSLALMSQHVRAFMQAMDWSTDAYEGLVDSMSGGLRVVKAIGKAVSFVVKILLSAVIVIHTLIESVFIIIHNIEEVPSILNNIFGPGTFEYYMAAWTGAIEILCGVLQTFAGMLVELWPIIQNTIPAVASILSAVMRVKDAVINLVIALATNEKVVTAFTAILNGLGTALAFIADKAALAINWLAGVIEALTGKLSLKSSGASAGSYYTEGFASGVSDGAADVVDAVHKLTNDVTEALEDDLEINSPSKVGYEDGRYTVEGFGNGIDENSDLAVDATKSMTGRVKTAMQDGAQDTAKTANKSIRSISDKLQQFVEDTRPISDAGSAGYSAAHALIAGLEDGVVNSSDWEHVAEVIIEKLIPQDTALYKIAMAYVDDLVGFLSDRIAGLERRLKSFDTWVNDMFIAFGQGCQNFVANLTPASIAWLMFADTLRRTVGSALEIGEDIASLAKRIGTSFIIVANSISKAIGRMGRAQLWTAVGTSLLEIAGAILILSITCIKYKDGVVFALEILGGIAATLFLLTTLSGHIALTKKALGGIMTTFVTLGGFAAIITSFGVAMTLFAAALLKLKDVSFESLSSGLAGLAISLAMLTAALTAISFLPATGFWGIVALSVLAVSFAKAITTLSQLMEAAKQLSWEDIGKFALSMYILSTTMMTVCNGLALLGQVGSQLSLVIAATGVSVALVSFSVGYLFRQLRLLTELMSSSECTEAWEKVRTVLVAWMIYLGAFTLTLVGLTIATKVMGLATLEVAMGMASIIKSISLFLFGIVALASVMAVMNLNPINSAVTFSSVLIALGKLFTSMINSLIKIIALCESISLVTLAQVEQIIDAASGCIIALGISMTAVVAACSLSFGLGAITGIIAMVVMMKTIVNAIQQMMVISRTVSLTASEISSLIIIIRSFAILVGAIGASIAIISLASGGLTSIGKYATMALSLAAMVGIIFALIPVIQAVTRAISVCNMSIDRNGLILVAEIFGGISIIIMSIGMLAAVMSTASIAGIAASLAVMALVFFGLEKVIYAINRINITESWGMLLQLGTIIALLISVTASVALLSMYPVKRLVNGLVGTTIIVAEMAALMWFIAKHVPNFNLGPTMQLAQALSVLIGVVSGIALILSIASFVGFNIYGPIVMIGLIVAAIGAMFWGISHMKVASDVVPAITAMTIALVSVGALCAAMAFTAKYAGMTETIAAFGLTLAAILVVIVGIKVLSDVCSKITLDLAKMYAIVAAIVATGAVVAAMGYVAALIGNSFKSWDNVGYALSTIAGITVAMSVLLAATRFMTSGIGGATKMLTAAIAITALGFALSSVASVAKEITFINWDQMWQCAIILGTIGVVLGGLIVALSLLSGTVAGGLVAAAILVALAAAIISTAAAIYKISEAIALLISLPIDTFFSKLATGLTTLNDVKNWGGILMGLAGVVLAFSVALLVLSPAFGILSLSMMAAGNGVRMMANAFYTVAEGIGVFATNIQIAKTVLENMGDKSTEFMFALGGWMAYFGVCMIPLGLGLTFLGVGLTACSFAANLMSFSLYNASLAFNLACGGIAKLESLLLGMADKVIAALPQITDAFVSLIDQLSQLQLNFGALAGISLLIWSFAGALLAIGTASIMFAAGALATAVGILAIAGALKVLSMVLNGSESVTDNFIVMVAKLAQIAPLFLILGYTMRPLANTLLVMSAGFVTLGFGLQMIAKGIDAINACDLNSFVNFMLTNGIGFAGAGAGLLVLGVGGLVGAVGLLALGGALSVVAEAMKLWGGVDVFCTFIDELGGSKASIAEAGAALLALGIGGAVGGAGLISLGLGLAAVAASMLIFPNGIADFRSFITILTNANGKLATVGLSLVVLAVGFAAIAASLAQLVIPLILIAAAVSLFPDGIDSIIWLIDTLSYSGPGMLAFAQSLLVLASAMTFANPVFLLGAVTLTALYVALTLITAIAPTFVMMATTLSTSVLTLATAISSAVNTIYAAISSVSTVDLFSKGLSAGNDYVAGIMQGLAGGTAGTDLATAAAALGNSVDEGFRSEDGIDSHSPSIKGFIAACFYNEGVHKGLAGGIDYLKDEAAESGQGIVSATMEMLTGKKTTNKLVKGLDNLAENGVSGFGSSLLSGLSEKWNDAKDGIAGLFTGDSSLLETFGLSSVSEALEEATSGLTNVSTSAEETKGTIESLRDSIEDSISIFEKFDDTTTISADDLLTNMESQINGITNWANGIETLGIRGMSAELIEYLADMGPEGYKYVVAFLDMTEEEFEYANDLYAQSLTLPDSAAATIKNGFEWAGVTIVESVVAGTYQAADEGEDAGEELVENVAKASYEEAKESKTLEQAGIQATYTFIKGLAEGADSDEYQRIMRETRGQALADLYNAGFADDLYSMYEIVDEYYAGNWRDFASDLAKHGSDTAEFYVKGYDEALTSTKIVDMIYKDGKIVGGLMNEGACDALDIHSPSRVAMKTAGYFAEGLCKGMKDSLTSVYNGSAEMGDLAVEGLEESIYNISDLFGMDMDTTPTIRPVLDLSNVNAGIANMDTLFGGRTIDANVNAINSNLKNKTDSAYELAHISQAMDKANQQYANRIVEALSGTDKNVTVQVNLQGDAAGLFKMVQQENIKVTKATGVSPLMIMRNNVNTISRRTSTT